MTLEREWWDALQYHLQAEFLLEREGWKVEHDNFQDAKPGKNAN